MGNLVLTLYKNPARNDDRVYLIPKNVSDINRVSEIVYVPKNFQFRITLALRLQENEVALRKKVVDRVFGGIEQLVEKVKLGELVYSDLKGRFENAN